MGAVIDSPPPIHLNHNPQNPMAKFSHLKALSVSDGDTAEFTFYEIGGAPVLTCAPATKVNSDFLNAVLKQSKAAQRKLRARKGQMPTAAQLEEVKQQDVVLFTKYIVKDWRNVEDFDGTPVEFSEEACQEFLLAIPDDMFEDLRAFCLDISNFRQEGMDPEEQEELMGN